MTLLDRFNYVLLPHIPMWEWIATIYVPVVIGYFS